jgi:hypothetical protein
MQPKLLEGVGWIYPKKGLQPISFEIDRCRRGSSILVSELEDRRFDYLLRKMFARMQGDFVGGDDTCAQIDARSYKFGRC